MPAEGAVQASDTGATANPSRLRYAVKTALALTLAYLVPMAMGWPQPQTAATTVMLIAATGAVSDSLQKGVLRVLGTVAGAIIGLSLVALFPQERLLYLSAVSITVAVIFYLYHAYQGDSTLFMLVRCSSVPECFSSLLMSFSRTVPSAVPSLMKGSRPTTPSSALK